MRLYVNILFVLMSCSREEMFIKDNKTSIDESHEYIHYPNVNMDDDFYYVYINSGSFYMGSPEEEIGRSNNEMQHEVFLTHSYYLSAFEVTRGMFTEFMPNVEDGSSLCLDQDCPIEFITWHQAAAYTAWLSNKKNVDECYLCEGEGADIRCIQNPDFRDVYDCYGYRLPTEAEWEYAARSKSQAAIWTPLGGGELPEGIEHSCVSDWIFEDGTYLGDWAWYCGNTEMSQPVGLKKPNGFGLYDMNGNVWEWTHDSFYEYSADSVENPTLHNQFDLMALRGGRWGNEPYALRSSKRIHILPQDSDGSFGFRIFYLAR